MSHVKFGYKPDGSPVPTEIDALNRAEKLVKMGAVSLRAAADFIYASTGRSISPSGLKHILDNRQVVGQG